MKKSSFFTEVYEIVRKIPEGKVSTYGQVAKTIGTRDARKVGWALHANKDEKTPCHRVVDKSGRVAPSYAFGGYHEQRNRLLAEGVLFIDELHVDLGKCEFRN